jgi:hypothetical protein
VIRRSITAGVSVLLTCTAFSASRPAPPPNPQPTEVKVVSVPPAQPTEVKIVSTPPAQPTEVKIVSAPLDESAHNVVTATWVLVIANGVLCIATFAGSWLQSRDTKRRDRAAMEREVNREAQRVMVTATRLDHMARQGPAVRDKLHLWGGMSTEIQKEIIAESEKRCARLKEIVDGALVIVGCDLTAMPEKKLAQHLFRLDEHEEQLDGLRDSITKELDELQEIRRAARI